MQRNLFTYIWRHSRPEQIVILGLVVLAQVFYFMSLTCPKSVINNGIQGNAFKDSKTIPFLVFELDLSAILPGKVLPHLRRLPGRPARLPGDHELRLPGRRNRERPCSRRPSTPRRPHGRAHAAPPALRALRPHPALPGRPTSARSSRPSSRP
jgi:hypothetical protein